MGNQGWLWLTKNNEIIIQATKVNVIYMTVLENWHGNGNISLLVETIYTTKKSMIFPADIVPLLHIYIKS